MTSRENESASAACNGCNGPVTILYCPGPAAAWNEWTSIPPRSKAVTIASRISAGALECREEDVLQSWSSKTSVPFLSLSRVNSSSNPTRNVSSRVRASLREVSVFPLYIWIFKRRTRQHSSGSFADRACRSNEVQDRYLSVSATRRPPHGQGYTVGASKR